MLYIMYLRILKNAVRYNSNSSSFEHESWNWLYSNAEGFEYEIDLDNLYSNT